MAVFINHSNHLSEKWPAGQKEAALAYGEIVDLEFPVVKADCNEDVVRGMAKEAFAKITAMHPVAVLCQGEYTYTYELVKMLKEAGITTVAACSERKASEVSNGEISRKITYFQFVRFRKY